MDCQVHGLDVGAGLRCVAGTTRDWPDSCRLLPRRACRWPNWCWSQIDSSASPSPAIPPARAYFICSKCWAMKRRWRRLSGRWRRSAVEINRASHSWSHNWRDWSAEHFS